MKNRQVRDVIHAWMAGVIDEKGWTATDWARRAGLPLSTLSRFLKDPDAAPLPSTGSIAQLAEAAGSQPRFIAEPQATVLAEIPLLTHHEFKSLCRGGSAASLEHYLACRGKERQTIAVGGMMEDPDERTFAVVIETDSLDGRHIRAGDTVVAALKPARAGDVVLFTCADELPDAPVDIGIYQPPYILNQSMRPRAPRPAEDCVVVAVVALVVRAL